MIQLLILASKSQNFASFGSENISARSELSVGLRNTRMIDAGEAAARSLPSRPEVVSGTLGPCSCG